MKIKYLDLGEKKAQAQNGKVYVFSRLNPIQDVEEKDLQEHLLKNCGDRFVREGETPPEEVKKEEKLEGEKKKKGRRKKK